MDDHCHSHDHSDGHDHKHDHNHSHGHSHDHDHKTAGAAGDHGHTHEHLEHPGLYADRDLPLSDRDFSQRAFTIGIGGPVGSGKTALMLELCKTLRDEYSIVAVTNDIFTREDGEFLLKHKALEESRIRAVETGGCPHAAIREDITTNLVACEQLTRKHNAQLILLESGGDNLAANFSRELADYTIYVIDVAGGDKVPRKGGPGITQSDLLVINKIDLAEAVGADLDVMKRDAATMRGTDTDEKSGEAGGSGAGAAAGVGPTVFAKVKFGDGVAEIKKCAIDAWEKVAPNANKRPPPSDDAGFNADKTENQRAKHS